MFRLLVTWRILCTLGKSEDYPDNLREAFIRSALAGNYEKVPGLTGSYRFAQLNRRRDCGWYMVHHVGACMCLPHGME